MTDRDQSMDTDDLLEAKRQVAVRAVERLLAACQRYEQPRWLNRYREVLNYLCQSRLQDAIFAECRLKNDSGSEYGNPEWVLSGELVEDVRKAISSIRTHIHYGDRRNPLNLRYEPADVESKGTIEQERNRMREVPPTPFHRDPIDDDPQFAEILAEVEKATEEALKDHPLRGGLGFCHVYWETKKSVLKERYGIEWTTPAELNPNVIFD